MDNELIGTIQDYFVRDFFLECLTYLQAYGLIEYLDSKGWKIEKKAVQPGSKDSHKNTRG